VIALQPFMLSVRRVVPVCELTSEVWSRTRDELDYTLSVFQTLYPCCQVAGAA
jgi:hypothetical protein